MSQKAAITVMRPREEVQRLWASAESGPERLRDAAVRFADAPGDRGTEVHVDLGDDGTIDRARAKDDLRRFKQRVETGEIPRSDATPEGERFERKLKQRPAQPLEESELEEVGLR